MLNLTNEHYCSICRILVMADFSHYEDSNRQDVRAMGLGGSMPLRFVRAVHYDGGVIFCEQCSDKLNLSDKFMPTTE